MKLLVLGANGRTGRAAVAQARRDGHRVTALVRRTDGLPAGAPALTAVLGDVVEDRDAVAVALGGVDAVLPALGNGLRVRDGRRPKIVGRAHETVAAADLAALLLRTATGGTHLRRRVVVSGPGR